MYTRRIGLKNIYLTVPHLYPSEQFLTRADRFSCLPAVIFFLFSSNATLLYTIGFRFSDPTQWCHFRADMFGMEPTKPEIPNFAMLELKPISCPYYHFFGYGL